MILISKYDKKIWENYVSNFEKLVILPQKDDLTNHKSYSKIQTIHKKKNSANYSKLSKKKKLKPDSVLDLHGNTLYSAKLLLNKFIINCYNKNIRNVLIITGKGQNNKGVLKEELPKLLSEETLNSYLINFNIAPRHFGGEGALLIRIKNKFKNS